MKTIKFAKPKTADQWIDAGVPEHTPKAPNGPMKRFTFDVPADLHRRVKAGCAARGTNMADLIRAFLDAEFPAVKP